MKSEPDTVGTTAEPPRGHVASPAVQGGGACTAPLPTPLRQRLLLAEDCLACNRLYLQPMCDQCADMEQAEETATERTPDTNDDD